jgi:hypothetical protein
MRDNADCTQAAAKIQNVFLRKRETKISFEISLFIKFFIYHFLYFIFLGPLLGLILLPFEGYYFVRNNGFFRKSRLCFLYFPIYSVFISYIIFIVYDQIEYNREISIEYLIGFFLIFILIITHCLITGIRFGFTNSKGIKENYTKDAPIVTRHSIIYG